MRSARTLRLLGGIWLAVFAAAIVALMASDPSCHPAMCHNLSPSEFWWWVESCWTPHCAECAMVGGF